MRSLRHLGLVIWLALALVAGQQLVLWHDLGHATERLAGKDEGGVPAKCEQHSACAQLASALGSAEFATAFVSSVPPLALAVAERDAARAPQVPFHSRAPPAFLA